MSRTILAVFLLAPAVAILLLVGFPGGSRAPVSTSPATSGAGVVAPGATARAWPAQFVSALDYLPRAPVTDGTVDYTVALQTAIDDAAGRTLVLPDFPIKVSKRAGQTWCLLVRRPITIVGVAGSEIRETQGRVQILRCESVDDARFVGFTIRGKGGQGTGLAHGILQVWGGSNVTVENVSVVDSDADGIVLANVRGAKVIDCRVARASKSGIYLSQCQGGTVQGSIVEDGPGHFTAQGNRVGAGIQLSSDADVACVGNIVRGGVGIGILCDANDTTIAPRGTVIAANRVEGVSNALNMDVSCGIRLQNLGVDTLTETFVVGNSVQGCGIYGLYVENHGRSTIAANTIVDSEWSGIVVGTVQGLSISGNTVRSSDRAQHGGTASVLLINQAAGVVASGNTFLEDAQVSAALPAVVDQTAGAANECEPRWRSGLAAPTTGRALRGDIVWNVAPSVGASAGWICVSGGAPGTWASFGRVE